MDPIPRIRRSSASVAAVLALWVSLGVAGGAVTLVGRNSWTPWWSVALFAALLMGYGLGTEVGRRASARTYVIGALLMFPMLVLLLIAVIGSQQIWLGHLLAAVMNVGYYRSGGPDDPYYDVMLFWPIVILVVVGLAMMAREMLLPRFEGRFSPPSEQ